MNDSVKYRNIVFYYVHNVVWFVIALDNFFYSVEYLSHDKHNERCSVPGGNRESALVLV